ncbi:MAG: right-handed parallel beta-helix repeat-containing protein [Verrucomicrobiae bacterium]|nr:right-handed parallel beta-helix repeat-containing protein [Verrucomicrobiae bacterium]
MNQRTFTNLILLLVLMTLAGCGNKNLHVDQARGKDSHPGTRSRPFATIERAQQALRELKNRGMWPKEGVTVEVAPGIYGPLRFETEDSGSKGAPAIYKATGRQRPVISGGKNVTHQIGDTADPAILARLNPEIRDKVRCIDLKAAGITDFGRLKPYVEGRQWDEAGYTTAPMELFINGRAQTLARWPDQGYVTVAGLPVPPQTRAAHGSRDPFIYYEGDRPARWVNTGDIWVHGFLTWDFDDRSARIKTITPEKRMIEFYSVAATVLDLGINKGQAYFYYNILEELDSPGEYWIDREAGRLYFYPPEGQPVHAATVSLSEKAVVECDTASHLRLEGFEISEGRSHGVEIGGGENVVIAGCTIRNVGSNGVMIRGGRGHGVDSCDIDHCGDGGIEMDGGDRKTLTPGGHFAVNNDIHHLGRRKECYRPGVNLYGVGNRAAHNRIHDLPHCGILFHGNDHVIEHNEIYRVALNSADVGAIYFPGSFAGRGSILRGNFIHHVGQPGYLCMGIYMDDLSGGVLIEGNIFYKVKRAVNIHGGRDIRVLNNYFIDCDPGICVGMWGNGILPEGWIDWVLKGPHRELVEMDYLNPPYSKRYPELSRLSPYFRPGTMDYIPPENLVARGNVFWKGVPFRFEGQNQPKVMMEMSDNLMDEDPLFLNEKKMDFVLRKNSPALRLPGFRAVNPVKIGLQTGPFRKAVPPRTLVDYTLDVIGPPTQVASGHTKTEDIPEHAPPPKVTQGDAFPVKITVANQGTEAAIIQPTLRFVPVEAGKPAAAPPLKIKAGSSPLIETVLTLNRTGVKRIYVYDKSEPYPAVRSKVEVGPVWIVSRSAEDRHPESVKTILSVEGTDLGNIRLDGDNSTLIVTAEIREKKPVRTEKFWEGSVLELYLSAPGDNKIQQLVFLPASGKAPARMLRYEGGVEIKGTNPVVWTFKQNRDSYFITATVPLKELGLEPGAGILMEAVVSARVLPGDKHQRTSLFGSQSAYLDNSRFARVKLSGD